jgi:phosphohistidine phosphatase
MILYLMRHASAGTRRENPLLDVKRGLVEEGKQQCVLMARALNALKVQIDLVVSSPLKRSMQTAQFVATELGYEGKVETSSTLGMDGSFNGFLELLSKYSGREGILAVGHNPNLFKFLGKLIAGQNGAAIRIRKGSIARIDLEHHPPRLQWLLDPRTVRLLYASAGKSSRPKTSRK